MKYLRGTYWGLGFTVYAVFLILLLALVVAPQFAYAAPPGMMNFQGRLRDDSGNIVPDGEYNMKFSIYTASSGGTPVWTETRQTSTRVEVVNGLFSTQLGKVTPIPASIFDNTDLYFEITMPTPATATCDTNGCASWESSMTPRSKLATSAYAFNAAMLNGKTDADFAAATGSTNYIQNTTSPQAANFNVTGNGTVGGALAVNSLLTVGDNQSTIKLTKLSDPSTLPITNANGVSFSPDNRLMLVTVNTTTASSAAVLYRRSGDIITSTSNPGGVASNAYDSAWRHDSRVAAVAHTRVSSSAPLNYTVRLWNRAIADAFMQGSNYVLPATAFGVDFSPDSTYMAVAHSSSPYIAIYKEGSNFTYPTKLSDPASLPASVSHDVAWSPDGEFLAVAHEVSPYITIYQRSGDTFTKLSNPASLPAGNARGVAWSPDGQYMAVAHSSSPYVTIYQRSGTTFTKLSNPSVLPAGVGNRAAWSPDGKYMSVAHSTSPYVTIYRQNGDTFTKIDNPSPIPAGTANDVAWSPDGKYMSVAHVNSPYITTYKVEPIADIYGNLKVSDSAWIQGTLDVQNGMYVNGKVTLAYGSSLEMKSSLGDVIFSANSSNGAVVVGTSSNNVRLSSSGIVLSGNARGTKTVSLHPEYAGATFTGDGSDNDGTLSSDFCSQSSYLNINADLCLSDTSGYAAHSYYHWIANGTSQQDYDIYVRHTLPSDYSTGSMTNFGWMYKINNITNAGSGDAAVTVSLYPENSSTPCSTATNTTGGTGWRSHNIASPLGSCTLQAGDRVVFRIRLVDRDNGNRYLMGGVMIGEIKYTYRTTF